MENKQKSNYVPWIIVGIVIIAFAFYVIGSNQSTSNQSNTVPTTDNTTVEQN